MVGRLEDPLPEGPFDLIVTALTVHHLDGPGKAALFARVAGRLAVRGRFVMADVVTPEDPDDAVTPIDGVFDQPSRLDDLSTWLTEAGLDGPLIWSHRDLAVIVAEHSVPRPEARWAPAGPPVATGFGDSTAERNGPGPNQFLGAVECGLPECRRRWCHQERRRRVEDVRTGWCPALRMSDAYGSRWRSSGGPSAGGWPGPVGWVPVPTGPGAEDPVHG